MSRTSIGKVVLGVAVLAFLSPASWAQEPSSSLGVPQSVRLQHEQIVFELEAVAERPGPTAVAASTAVALLKAHYAKEEEFVLPALGLLPTLLDDPTPSDLDRAVEIADQTKAMLSELTDDHVQITAAMTELIEAGARANDQYLIRLATRVAAQSLNDVEVVHPTAILIGAYVRAMQPGK